MPAKPVQRIDEIGEIPEPPIPVPEPVEPIVGPGGEVYGDAHTTPPMHDGETPSLISPPGSEPIPPPE